MSTFSWIQRGLIKKLRERSHPDSMLFVAIPANVLHEMRGEEIYEEGRNLIHIRRGQARCGKRCNEIL